MVYQRRTLALSSATRTVCFRGRARPARGTSCSLATRPGASPPTSPSLLSGSDFCPVPGTRHTLRPTQVSDLLLMTLINPLPFARLMTIGLYPHIAAYRLSGHTAAASSVGWPVPSAWHGTALYSGRVGRHQCAYGEGACSQAGDHRFGQHGSSADPSIVLENGPSFALVNRTRRLLHRPRGGHAR